MPSRIQFALKRLPLLLLATLFLVERQSGRHALHDDPQRRR